MSWAVTWWRPPWSDSGRESSWCDWLFCFSNSLIQLWRPRIELVTVINSATGRQASKLYFFVYHYACDSVALLRFSSNETSGVFPPRWVWSEDQALNRKLLTRGIHLHAVYTVCCLMQVQFPLLLTLLGLKCVSVLSASPLPWNRVSEWRSTSCVGSHVTRCRWSVCDFRREREREREREQRVPQNRFYVGLKKVSGASVLII